MQVASDSGAFTIGSDQLTAASGVTWQPMNAALATWTSSNGLANTLSYDTDGRLTAINTPGVESLGFSYDTANRLVGIDNALNGALSQNFDYDDQSRLVSMISGTMTASYGYDADGNRITGVQSGASNSTGYSATSNHLVSTTGSNPQTYGYDALGNVTTLGGTTAYQYDAFNRMSAAGGMSYYVNPEGQRLRKTGSLGTTYFAPDQGGTLMAEDDSGAWIDYLWLGGRLIGREVNGQLEVIGDDQTGRPQVVTNAAQTVVWSAQNWPYTQNVTVSNSAPQNLGFPGQYYDQETGLWNNGFRDYDPTLGRYVESDPLGLAGGSWSTYAYVDENPLSNIDPLGAESGKYALYFGGVTNSIDPPSGGNGYTSGNTNYIATGTGLGLVAGFTGGALVVANIIGFPEVEAGEGIALGVLGAGGLESLEFMDAVAGEPFASLAVGGIAGMGPGATVGTLTGYILDPAHTPQQPCQNN